MAVNVRKMRPPEHRNWSIVLGASTNDPFPETQGQQQEQDQPAPLPPVSSHQGPAEEELDALIW
jgi:hypothetical protein